MTVAMDKCTHASWRLLQDGPLDGRISMATDRALLQACAEGKSPPTLRLYCWDRPTLTVGYSRDPDRQLDRARCREWGIPIVPRPTGGRALLHHREFTYSVVAPIPHPWFPSALRGAFQAVSGALLCFLRRLGIRDAEIADRKKNPPVSDSARPNSPSCFAALNHFEISVRDRKLVGSAQRRLHRAFLQQGSVMIDCDREFMNSLFRFDSEEHRRRSLQHLQRHTLTLNELRGGDLSIQELAQAFEQGFRDAFPVTWIDGGLTPYESQLRAEMIHDPSGNFVCPSVPF